MQNEKAKRGLNQVFRYNHSLMAPKVILEATNGRLPVDLAVPEEILGWASCYSGMKVKV
jgi:hypothetical protein